MAQSDNALGGDVRVCIGYYIRLLIYIQVVGVFIYLFSGCVIILFILIYNNIYYLQILFPRNAPS